MHFKIFSIQIEAALAAAVCPTAAGFLCQDETVVVPKRHSPYEMSVGEVDTTPSFV